MVLKKSNFIICMFITSWASINCWKYYSLLTAPHIMNCLGIFIDNYWIINATIYFWTSIHCYQSICWFLCDYQIIWITVDCGKFGNWEVKISNTSYFLILFYYVEYIELLFEVYEQIIKLWEKRHLRFR